jgi:hypothetical protein
MVESREFSSYATASDKEHLRALLNPIQNPGRYKEAMKVLGSSLGEIVGTKVPKGSQCLVVSTAEDADYLSFGVIESLNKEFKTSAAVFWNNHYSLLYKDSVAPIVHQYLQPGYQASDVLVIVKSVISGSCVVRTNILALIESVNAKNIFIVSPVMHSASEAKLKEEFPKQVSDKFDFVYFALDNEKDDATGEVKPGIGGQIYELLGLTGQPARGSYMPDLVRRLAFE